MGCPMELACPEGHSALLRLQDSELRLLELMKKWMVQRSRSDREYGSLLHQMYCLAEKQEGAGGQARNDDSGSQISQCWWLLASQTETLSRILRRHADDLVAGPLHKLGLLIRNKQQLRRSYSEQWERLSQDFTRVPALSPTRGHQP
uniref:F-BAR domain-containing protein n=1 Tax=Sphenodon punctatus TaxID=8508 RepID=A0A8D0GSY8_SPHPU